MNENGKNLNSENLSAEEIKTALLSMNETSILESVIRDVGIQMTRKNILKEHPYNIWQSSDGRWYTKVKTDNGFHNIKKTNYDDLIDALVAFYNPQEACHTLAQLYPQFIEFKILETSDGNGSKLQWVWSTYYAGSEIVNTDMSTLTTKSIKAWLLSIVEERELDRRHYQEFKSIINMMLDYAVEEGILVHNPAREIHNIGKKHFYEKEEKAYDEQVFRKELVEELIPLCFKQFEKTKNTAYYGVVLNFHLGLRVGELVTLKPTDFDFKNHILWIRRMEQKTHYRDDNGVIHRSGYHIVHYTKSTDGLRNITLTPEAEALAKLIIKQNPSDFEWLFYSTRTNDRLKNDGINNVLRRLNKKLDTAQKPNHSIRKTDISNLFSSNNHFTEDEVRRFAGHHDSLTTHKYYEFAKTNSADKLPAYAEAFHSDALTEILAKMSGTQVGPKNPE